MTRSGSSSRKLLGLKPQSNLLLCAVDSVRPVADVAANIDAKVPADRPGERLRGLGGAQEHAASLDDAVALPHHGDDGPRLHVLDERGEEGLGGEVGVVVLEELLRGASHLHRHELEALVLETRDDGADDATLDAVRLDHDEGTLALGHVWDCR
eukprot:CAMPEP_0169450186 /NCGR_PEP_ID=MMETSP1042-20121227/13018_1 /TAXON_ID=464988 /ORGANISM="Hemiselmis andersenii, Strain CCMP1180" /LENGTH=153 /DNA_ID=CAMNT_0009561991 /DNA_START=43 /DNA_END=501 /DNA_ORIENTATION=+